MTEIVAEMITLDLGNVRELALEVWARLRFKSIRGFVALQLEAFLGEMLAKLAVVHYSKSTM